MTFKKDSRKKSKTMTYNIKKGKYIVCKDLMYCSMTYEQVIEMKELCEEIIIKSSSAMTNNNFDNE